VIYVDLRHEEPVSFRAVPHSPPQDLTFTRAVQLFSALFADSLFAESELFSIF